MARVLFANFLFTILPILLTVSGIFLIAKGRTMARRCVGIFLIALPIGPILYITAGIVQRWIRADKSFYGVPFGGYGLSDNTGVGISLIIWICAVIVVLAGILRRRA
jgi:hypothetical protein